MPKSRSIFALGDAHIAPGAPPPEHGSEDTYDYVGAVMWNALATRLWARTVQLVNRKTARLLGIRQRDWPQRGRVSVAKVAEYQT